MRMETFDWLQFLRTHVLWPLVIGSAGFLLARNLLWLATRRTSRGQAYACLATGVAGMALGWIIAGAWNDDVIGYWVAFTAGMALLAGVMLFTVAVSFLGMWYNKDGPP